MDRVLIIPGAVTSGYVNLHLFVCFFWFLFSSLVLGSVCGVSPNRPRLSPHEIIMNMNLGRSFIQLFDV